MCAMAQSPVTYSVHDSCTDLPECRCPIIKLSIQVVTTVTNHSKFYNRYAWMDT